jgi:hypothetical protein
LSKNVGTRTEYTIFWYRPDIIVVFHLTLGIVLDVEVKEPEKKNPQEADRMMSRGSKTQPKQQMKNKEVAGVFDKDVLVAGQMFDYLKGMISMRNATPFGLLLTTFDKAVHAWILFDESSSLLNEELTGLAAGPGQHRDSSCPPRTGAQNRARRPARSPRR